MAGFQNWMALDAAPSSPRSQSGIAGTEFENWENLVGPSDIAKQMMGMQKPASGSGIQNSAPPPQNIQEFAQQAIAPYQQKLDRVTAAAGQLQQGNVVSAYGAYRGAKQPTIAPITGQPAVSDDYDYTHALNQ